MKQGLGELPGWGQQYIILVNVDSDLESVWGRTQPRDNVSPCPETIQISFSLHVSLVPFKLLSLCWSSGWVPVREWVCAGPLRECLFTADLCLPGVGWIATVLHSQLLWEQLFSALGPGSQCGAGTHNIGFQLSHNISFFPISIPWMSVRPPIV